MDFTLTPDPDEFALIAARKLRAIGIPAQGAALTAAQALIEDGIEVTKANVADALHEPE